MALFSLSQAVNELVACPDAASLTEAALKKFATPERSERGPGRFLGLNLGQAT